MTLREDPEVFLLAASRLGVPTDRCIVVEDAGAGIEGARRAGMRSIGVSHNGKNLHADLVVHSLELLEPDAFDRLLNQSESCGAADPVCPALHLRRIQCPEKHG